MNAHPAVDTTREADQPEPPGAEEDVQLSISDRPVNQNALPSGARMGADIRFLGVVRGEENQRPIRGIRYSAYLPMAERELAKIAEEGRRRFGPHPLTIHHVVGEVAAGAPSVVIRLALPHSREAFAAIDWYLRELKSRVPIWKEPIYS